MIIYVIMDFQPDPGIWKKPFFGFLWRVLYRKIGLWAKWQTQNTIRPLKLEAPESLAESPGKNRTGILKFPQENMVGPPK